MADDVVVRVVREMLAVIPAGCTWLLPVRAADGAVTDFRVAATSGRSHDLLHRGTSRVDAVLSELYPSIVDGPLWRVYREVLDSGEPAELVEWPYEEQRAGVAAHSRYDVDVTPVLGGLMVWWRRVDDDRQRLAKTELLGSLGWTEYDVVTGRSVWSPGMYRIFGRSPQEGPLSRAAQAAAMLPEDRGVAETAWQTLDTGATSDVTVRFRVGEAV